MDTGEYLIVLETDGVSPAMLNRCHLEYTLQTTEEEGWQLVVAIPAYNELLLIIKRRPH